MIFGELRGLRVVWIVMEIGRSVWDTGNNN